MIKKTMAACLFFFGTIVASAQSQPVFSVPDDDIVLMCTYTLPSRAVMDSVEEIIPIDSLLSYYIEHGIKPNPMIKQYRILQHYIGMDSYKVVMFYHLDKFSNINSQEMKTVELLYHSFKNKEERSKFWKCFYLLFDRHEDNIMIDWTKPVVK